jgi:hypothetical protein
MDEWHSSSKSVEQIHLLEPTAETSSRRRVLNAPVHLSIRKRWGECARILTGFEQVVFHLGLQLPKTESDRGHYLSAQKVHSIAALCMSQQSMLEKYHIKIAGL